MCNILVKDQYMSIYHRSHLILLNVRAAVLPLTGSTEEEV